MGRLCPTGVESYERRPIRYREMVLTLINRLPGRLCPRVLREVTHPLSRDGTDSDQWTTESPLLNGGRVLREATHPLPRDGTDCDQWHSDQWTLINRL